jgi:hypothetical protein
LTTTNIGGLEVSRLALGSNPFFGFSHQTAARDQWLRRHFTDERIYEVLHAAADLGINLFVSGANERFAALRQRLQRETGFHINWACTPSAEDLAGLKAEIERSAALGAEICMPHTAWLEARLRLHEREVVEMPEALEHIRRQGMIPGIATHRPEAVGIAAERGYDAQTFIVPLNVVGFLCPFEVEWQARVIRDCPKPVICIKPLAAGRLTPLPGLTFVYEHIKPTDTVAIGVLSPEELREDAAIAADLLARRPAAVDLQSTRSKDHLRQVSGQVRAAG